MLWGGACAGGVHLQRGEERRRGLYRAGLRRPGRKRPRRRRGWRHASKAGLQPRQGPFKYEVGRFRLVLQNRPLRWGGIFSGFQRLSLCNNLLSLCNPRSICLPTSNLTGKTARYIWIPIFGSSHSFVSRYEELNPNLVDPDSGLKSYDQVHLTICHTPSVITKVDFFPLARAKLLASQKNPNLWPEPDLWLAPNRLPNPW